MRRAPPAIAVVLDQPQDLVNIAHVVRAMKNFGLGELRLVSPREFDAYRIAGIAHRTGDILAATSVYRSLDDALADCVHVVATTARGREARHNLQRPREAAAEIVALSETGRVALLFGREDKGLSNEALDRAHRVVTIPTDPEYPSLNLGHAVALMLYEIALARGAEAVPLKPPRRKSPPATTAELELLFADAERALEAIGFFKTRATERIMRTLRAVAHRQPLDQREAKLLRAMAIEVARRIRV
jgi:tRNA/rRNA methyltransferase/tRNA (cytidine32/uridine32-2'-O)-methyltransferase